MNFLGRDFVSIGDVSKQELLYVLEKAREFDGKDKYGLLTKKIVALCFFEPSTRTKMSFDSAALRLGASTIGFSDPSTISQRKGETLWDTIKMVEQYADVIVMRHYAEGAARLAAEASKVPIINGGDGINQHPTQTLLDLYTIEKVKGTLDNLNVGMMGDLKYGRTVHSLTKALAHFNCKMYFISPPELRMPQHYLEELQEKNIYYLETENLDKVLPELDVLYVTRVQKERFSNPEEYERLKNYYVLDRKSLLEAKKELIIMHPLPRVGEIKKEVDDTEYARYFEQAGNGIPVRQAILSLVLGAIKTEKFVEKPMEYREQKCSNPNCISNLELSTSKIIKINGRDQCYYCEKVL